MGMNKRHLQSVAVSFNIGVYTAEKPLYAGNIPLRNQFNVVVVLYYL